MLQVVAAGARRGESGCLTPGRGVTGGETARGDYGQTCVAMRSGGAGRVRWFRTFPGW
jgi:hypothetical protein